MSDPIQHTVKLRLKSGHVETIDDAIVLEVDGKPFVAVDDNEAQFQAIYDALNRMDARMDELSRQVAMKHAANP